MAVPDKIFLKLWKTIKDEYIYCSYMDHYLQSQEEKIQKGALPSFPDFPWHNRNFSEGRGGCFGAFSCLNHRYNLPSHSPEEWRLKTSFFAISLLCFVVGWHSAKVSSRVSSPLGSLCSTTMWIATDWCKLEDTRSRVQTCSALEVMWEAPYKSS